MTSTFRSPCVYCGATTWVSDDEPAAVCPAHLRLDSLQEATTP